MRLSKSQVQHISDLARLNLSDEDIGRFQKQLSSILEYVELLDKVKTEGTEVTAQTTGLKNVTRKDSPCMAGRQACEEASLTQEEVLSNAPEKQNGYIKTKAVFG